VTSTVTYNLRFPGQYYMAETGLNQNYFRDYDSATGRYIESDPIGLRAGSFSSYLYAESNPLWFFDVVGLMSQSCNCPNAGLSNESCCQAALVQGLFRESNGENAGGITICCGGSKRPCAYPLGPGTGSGVLTKCIVAHERKHYPDIQCKDCDLARPGWAPGRPAAAGECNGYTAEVACLRSSRGMCNGDPSCIASVEARIAQIVAAYASKFGQKCPGLN